MLFEGITQLDDMALTDQGHIHIDLAIQNGIVGLVGGLFIVYPLLYYMK